MVRLLFAQGVCILQLICLEIYREIALTKAFELVGCRGERLSMDEKIASAFELNDPKHLTDDDTYVTELDILHEKDENQILNPKSDVTGSLRSKRKAVRDIGMRWPYRIIFYKFETGIFSYEDWYQIYLAVREWKTHTCLRFVWHRDAINYLYFRNSSMCGSHVGFKGGKQDFNLAPQCRKADVISHEIGHAIGFFHEHMRPDRTKFVRILWGNMIWSHFRDFEALGKRQINTYGVPYDYGSLMHYGEYASSKNGRPTIQALDVSKQKLMGQSKNLSFYDIKLANLMYACNSLCRVRNTCPSYGFMAKDCKCYCPGNPTILCSMYKSTTAPPPTTKAPKKLPPIYRPRCRDARYDCKPQALKGRCTTDKLMPSVCRKTCNYCDEPQDPTANFPITLNLNLEAPCIDHSDDCPKWRNMGFCNTDNFYRESMLSKCKKTCSQCDRSVKNNGSVWLLSLFSTLISVSIIL